LENYAIEVGLRPMLSSGLTAQAREAGETPALSRNCDPSPETVSQVAELCWCLAREETGSGRVDGSRLTCVANGPPSWRAVSCFPFRVGEHVGSRAGRLA